MSSLVELQAIGSAMEIGGELITPYQSTLHVAMILLYSKRLYI